MEKKTLCKLLLGAAAAAALPVYLTAPGRATQRQKAPFQWANLAHRGLHSPDKSVPENSLEAFRLAAEAGYGVELDVQLTKDGQVVVFHDEKLDRVCGVPGRVDEFTFAELQQFRLCGTEQRIPLFSDVLAVIRGRGPLLVELKNGKRNKELCKKTYALLQGYKGDVCIESFNPRGQLAAPVADYVKDGFQKPLGFVLSRTLLNFLARPQFIAYKIGRRPLLVRLSEKLGAMKVGWTSHDPVNEKGRDAVIFEFYRPKLRYK